MKPTIVLRFACISLLALLAAKPVGANEPTLIGVWLHQNKLVEVAIAPCGDRLCGKIVWLKSPNDIFGEPLADSRNPSPALRERPLLGLTVLSGLRSTGEGTWDDGKIYNPVDGKKYLAQVSIEDDGTLRVFAYTFIPTVGKAETWTRVRYPAQYSEN
jgi:uncharacterized protein (DUF2147 family)